MIVLSLSQKTQLVRKQEVPKKRKDNFFNKNVREKYIIPYLFGLSIIKTTKYKA